MHMLLVLGADHLLTPYKAVERVSQTIPPVLYQLMKKIASALWV